MRRRRTLLRRLDYSVIKADADPDVLQYNISEIHQLRDELSYLDEVVSTGLDYHYMPIEILDHEKIG